MVIEKNDVSLYVEVKGEGEALLLIHGVIVDAGLYERTSEILSKCYKVITYDRRGNSRSILKEGADPCFTMDDQADDIRDILDALGVEKTYVVGASGGAAVGQFFMKKYPEKVKHLIMYEPSALGMLAAEDEETAAWTEEMHRLIEKKRYNSVLLRFSESIGAPDSRSPVRSEEDSMRQYGNIEYAFTVEFPGLVRNPPDIEFMKAVKDRITLAAGEKSGDSKYVRIARMLAEKTGCRLVYYPGGHNLPFELPEEFAICVIGTLILQI